MFNTRVKIHSYHIQSDNCNGFNVNDWKEKSNQSIFIKRIPSWFDQDAVKFHTQHLGEISRVHIVDVNPEKGSGRMAFVHFNHWYDTPYSNQVRIEIANHPNHVHVMSISHPTYNDFNLHMTYNTRPIPRTTYDLDQLTDMINTLNAENSNLKENMSVMNDTLNYQETMIQQLLDKMQHLECTVLQK